MSDDLITSLRALAAARHDDLSIAVDAVIEIERLRAEVERLDNEDTKTRHALKGWAFVCPDGGADPTHERVAAVVAEVERLRTGLHRVSLASQNSMSSKDECGRIARETLEAKP